MSHRFKEKSKEIISKRFFESKRYLFCSYYFFFHINENSCLYFKKFGKSNVEPNMKQTQNQNHKSQLNLTQILSKKN